MHSLRRRLGIGLAIGVIVLWSAATLVSSLVVRHEIDEVQDRALEQSARRLLAFAGGGSRPGGGTAPFEHDSFRRFVVRNDDGEVVLTSPEAEDTHEDGRVPDAYRADRAVRMFQLSDPDRHLSIEIADPLDYRQQAFRESVTALVAPLPLLVPLSLALVWFIVRTSLGSVATLRERIESRGERDLAPLPVEDLPTELRPIVTSVNGLMSRLERAIEAERDFASNSAHELRTPIAAALAGTQRLIAGLRDEDSRERALQVEIALRSLAALAAKLVQLARAESGFLVGDDAVDLHAVLPHIVAEARSLAHDAGRLRYRAIPPERFLTRLDADGLAILLRNLIENALKHSPPGSFVDVVLDGTRNEIRVTNDGPVVVPGSLQASRERFARGETRAEGAGLGLSIIDAVTRDSGVDVELRSPATGRRDGFEAMVSASAAGP